ncbi:MAG TPA: hypothetical protein VMS49_01475 [Lysobacter sp.]|nr:hypothetical protein [Lysobacter sp.]
MKGRFVMKVNELISHLEKCDRDMELMCFCDDEGSRQRSPFRVYVVERVNVSSVVHRRNADRTPHIEFNGDYGQRVLIFQITTDF